MRISQNRSPRTTPRISFEEAAAVPYGTLTALPYIRDHGKLEQGQKILINGASGSIGTFAVQLAKHFGAEVTGVCSTANMKLVTSLGADRVVDYTREDVTADGQRYDVIFDTIGKLAFSGCRACLTPKGIYLTAVPSSIIVPQMLWTSIRGGKRTKLVTTGPRPQGERRPIYGSCGSLSRGVRSRRLLADLTH